MGCWACAGMSCFGHGWAGHWHGVIFASLEMNFSWAGLSVGRVRHGPGYACAGHLLVHP
jgi:hypothetical protein